MSYIPFLAGKRICFGKQFADVVNRVVTSMLLHHFEMEFEDPTFMKEYPRLEINSFETQEVYFVL